MIKVLFLSLLAFGAASSTKISAEDSMDYYYGNSGFGYFGIGDFETADPFFDRKKFCSGRIVKCGPWGPCRKSFFSGTQLRSCVTDCGDLVSGGTLPGTFRECGGSENSKFFRRYDLDYFRNDP